MITSNLLTSIRTDVKAYLETVLLHGAVGTSSTTPTLGDTTLGAEVERNPISAFDDSVADKITASLIIATTEANGSALAECGWLTLSSGGTLLVHDLLTVINKTSDIELYLDTTITIVVEEV